MVTFFLVNPTRNISAVSILVSFKGCKYRRSVRESVEVRFWNKLKKRVRVTPNYTQGNIINDILNKWESAALNTVAHFKNNRTPPNRDIFFAQLDKEFYNDSASQTIYFTDYFSIYRDRFKGMRSLSVIKNLNSTQRKLIEFEKHIRKRLTFNDINPVFYKNFQQWCFIQNLHDNYFGLLISIIKKVYIEARTVDKLHNLHEIEHKNFRVIFKDTDNVYLSQKELIQIHNLEISDKSVSTLFPSIRNNLLERRVELLQLVRDLFLVGACTGLRFSDFGRLSEQNVGEYICITTTKTKTQLTIPIHPIVKEIIERGLIFNRRISLVEINKYIKIIARMAGIVEKVLINKYVGGKVETFYTEKYNLISSHTARRSFATNAYKAGVPSLAIRKITGHKSENSFLKYIKVSNEENAEMLKSHPFFNKM